METIYISIEKNVDVFEQYKKLWSDLGIAGVRVDSMTEGIKTALAIGKTETQSIYFIDIVAGDIDFMPLLPFLNEAVDSPILIAASKSHYTEDEHHMALNNGAYFYGAYCDDSERNINGVMSAVKSYYRAAKKQKNPADILTYSGILISLSRHKAYIDNTLIALTSQEFDVLHLFMLNIGTVLTHNEIYRHIHKDEYDEKTAKYIVYNSMNRLCQKMRNAANRDYIQSVYDVGYRLSFDTK